MVRSSSQPLAYRMRPKSLSDFVGQKHIVGKGRMLRRMIEADRLSSVIFYGPPGTGKTALAEVIANTTKLPFARLNATEDGVKRIREVVEEAKNAILNPHRKIILFFDEIHRLNTGQQDVLLPYIENGLVILIGATTENPYFEVNKALLSRSTIFRFFPLTIEEIKEVIIRALEDKDFGYGNDRVVLTDEALRHFAFASGGDARKALNGLELGVLTTPRNEEGVVCITRNIAEECIQQKAVLYDKKGDNHYDIISAFIKSMRGTSPDAALHYLARMLEAGEDPEFIARRIIIAASEDVGLANPAALQVAVAAAQGVKMIGMPEAKILLAQAAVFVATSPKSNASYMGIMEAIDDIHKGDIGLVPPHLRDAHYSGAKSFGHGNGYKYPHDYPGNYVLQEYLPEPLVGKTYYRPTENGYERRIKEKLEKVKGQKNSL